MNRAHLLAAILVTLLCCACTPKSGTESSSTPTAETSAEPTAVTVATSPSPAGMTVSFTDISGYDGERAIKALGALGVFETTSGEFHPNDPITRGEFARWLVLAQNRIAEDGYHIKLAQTGPATFVDVPTTDPEFPYIQGLANAGFVVGVDPTHYSPAAPLTREQMIYIKAQVDEHAPITTNGNSLGWVQNQFSDASKITKKYVGAIYEDRAATTTETFTRVYGMTKVFGPQLHVTRGEAAVALSQVKGEWTRDAEHPLGESPMP